MVQKNWNGCFLTWSMRTWKIRQSQYYISACRIYVCVLQCRRTLQIIRGSKNIGQFQCISHAHEIVLVCIQWIRACVCASWRIQAFVLFIHTHTQTMFAYTHIQCSYTHLRDSHCCMHVIVDVLNLFTPIRDMVSLSIPPNAHYITHRIWQ